MTDHAAEAQRHLRDLQNIDWPRGDLYSPTSDEHTAHALLAITHTLQAILERLPNREAPRETAAACDHIGLCVLPTHHDGPHRANDGMTWGPAPCGETRVDIDGLPCAPNYPCTNPAGHDGPHADSDGDQW